MTTNFHKLASDIIQQYRGGSQNRKPDPSRQDGLPATVSAKLLDGAGRVRATAAEHPGSTGGYVGQITVYDVMGRATASSNPTEIYGSWQPAGDDTAWVYSYQTYDWKGRPRVSTNQDGSTKEATYGGCGCAGGEVVTMRDEVNRYSKIYHDVLGRVSKSEELNSDQTIYRTTTTTFNALDQATRVRQYQGSFTSPRFQDTTMTYDGYARLKTKRRPENDPGTSTNFDYYADGTLQKITDARGATINHAYNNRHQITGITYGVPTGSSIVVTPSVGYSYDAAGNRTQMTDGLGNHTYQYDQLSRLTSETRSITEINKSYTLNYGYNVGGELTSISDPADTGRNLTYVYDQAGRLTTVNGNQSAAFANVSQYASNLQYRASGALKHLTYGTGSGKNLDNQYNSRMQISRFEVNTIIGSTYQYYADGRIKFVDDISMTVPASDKFDRSYVYDHAGRLTEAKSGTEAHTPSVTSDDRPYRETFGFDEWSNLTARTGRVWTTDMLPVSTEYMDNRCQDWEYDADGRPTVQTPLTSEYDASGRKIKTVDSTDRSGHGPVDLTIIQGSDGDGQRLKHQEDFTVTYLIRSSVLGDVVWEIGKVNNVWQKKTGFVYGGGRMLATQTGAAGPAVVTWRYQNPVTGSQRGLKPTELDPLGLNAGLSAPPEGGPEGGGELPDLVFPRYGDIMNGRTGCTQDGAKVSCDSVTAAMDSGAAAQCPDNDCGPRIRTVTAYGLHGEVRSSSSTIVRPGQIGWDGSADGRYRRVEVRREGELSIAWGGDIFTRVSGTLGGTMPDKIVGLKLLPAGGSYSQNKQKLVTTALARIFNSKECADAFKKWGLRTPTDLIMNDGLAIGPASLLLDPNNVSSIGITEAARSRDAERVGYTSVQGITIRDHPGYNPDTTDGSARIFLNTSAFGGGHYSLQEVLVHELIHVAGIDGVEPGWFWEKFGYHDLSQFAGYDEIMAACTK